ncbi:hypothetical protein [Dokdonella sp.]|uniref:hypothetical protein n=1 Tax=Dokdonella sp. TaxID=2291710 RepID=UPI0031CB66DB|nr:hypothetical protein [Dokdonella sp.]
MDKTPRDHPAVEHMWRGAGVESGGRCRSQRHRRRWPWTFILSALLLASLSVLADDNPTFIHRDSFIAAHPDLYWRRQGVRDYVRGRHAEAMKAFQRAAKYADKPSQAMIAQMLWNGDGVPADPVMAYAWADLSAERGYPVFVATREKFWSELDADQRRAAVAKGQAIFDEYADDVAKRREEKALLLARRQITGSRTGHVGALIVKQVNHSTGQTDDTEGVLYYADKYWQPEQYWQWQDNHWLPDPKEKVEVGPIRVPPGK